MNSRPARFWQIFELSGLFGCAAPLEKALVMEADGMVGCIEAWLWVAGCYLILSLWTEEAAVSRGTIGNVVAGRFHALRGVV
jgi:hypothetical protein